MKRLLTTRRLSTITSTTTSPTVLTHDVPAASQPPLYHPHRILRVFLLPNQTPFLQSYLTMRRLIHHRLLHDKHTPQHSRTDDERDADCLLVSEPTAVYTMGRAAKLRHVRLTTPPLECTSIEQATALLAALPPSTSPPPQQPQQPQLLRVDRGGETTWHGPGQLLLYPLINLHHTRCDLHAHLRTLEAAIASALHSLPLHPSPPVRSDPAYTGVWREGRKLAAIGLNCSRWHTTHGIALNVDVDKQHYAAITPCGIEESGRTVGNVREEWEREGRVWGSGGGCDYEVVRESVIRELGAGFGMECVMETESVDIVLQRWDETELRRTDTLAGSVSSVAAATAVSPPSATLDSASTAARAVM